MGETLAETRVEVDAQRSEVEQTADQLQSRVRHALDLKARFKENPLLFIGVGAGALYLVTGGPIWTAKLLRRRLRPTRPEQAYDALPRPMQKWVDSLVADVGPTARDARNTLSEEIANWRLAPLKNKKARRELAKAMVEGPPGPSRAGWKAAEAALLLVTAAVTRRAVDQFVLGRKPEGGLDLRRGAPDSPKEAAKEYSGMSDRGRG
jgi:hypothetical protein